jgi:hypothetical protein
MDRPPNLALVIIYNHRYDQNIDLLERVYRDRFGHIFHLMPFYTGDRANVIPVYGNAHYFSGFVAQGFRHFHRPEFTHYLFIADDLILNPAVDARNFQEAMGLPPGHCYLPGFHRTGPKEQGFWMHARSSVEWTPKAWGLEVAHQLPSAEEAAARLKRHGLRLEPLSFRRVFKTPVGWREWLRLALSNPALFAHRARGVLRNVTFTQRYPLAAGYSDIFMVTSDAIAEFASLCGMLAAANLFVEHAIPTAMALSANAVAEDLSLKLRGKALWTPEQHKALERYDMSLSALLSDFPEGWLYVHPVKLSRWMGDLDVTLRHSVSWAELVESPGGRNQVKDVRVEGEDLRVTSTGSDPFIVLPKVPLDPSRDTSVRLELTVPEPTLVQLYYQGSAERDFRQQDCLTWRAPAGRGRLIRRISQPLNGMFRIDPGTCSGSFRIHRIEFIQ